MVPTPSEVERQTREGQRDMIETEEAALALLLLMSRVRRRDDAASIRDRLTRTIYSVMTSARSASRTRIIAELSSYGINVTPTLPGASAALDMKRAGDLATGYVSDWVEIVDSSGEDLRKAKRRASRKLRHRIVTIAITESDLTYNDERDKVAIHNADRLQEFVKAWDASMDKRTCSICEGMDGTWINTSESWPSGPPGSAHPRCRCYESIVPRSMV